MPYPWTLYQLLLSSPALSYTIIVVMSLRRSHTTYEICQWLLCTITTCSGLRGCLKNWSLNFLIYVCLFVTHACFDFPALFSPYYLFFLLLIHFSFSCCCNSLVLWHCRHHLVISHSCRVRELSSSCMNCLRRLRWTFFVVYVEPSSTLFTPCESFILCLLTVVRAVCEICCSISVIFHWVTVHFHFWSTPESSLQ